MNKTITITRYAGLDNRTTDQLLSLNFFRDVTLADLPPSSDRKLRTMLLLEDATAIMSGTGVSTDNSRSPILQAYRNASWFGIGIVASVQGVSAIPDDIVNNVKTYVVFRSPNPVEANRLAKILGGGPELAEVIQHLPPRHFVAWSESYEGPIHGESLTINTGARPTEQQVEDHMRPILEDIAKNLVLSPPYESEHNLPIIYLEDDGEESKPKPNCDPTPRSLSPEVVTLYARFLSAVASNQYHSVRELNSGLGLSAGKAARLKSDLESQGYISVRKEPVATGRPRLVVQIEPKGAELLEKCGVEL